MHRHTRLLLAVVALFAIVAGSCCAAHSSRVREGLTPLQLMTNREDTKNYAKQVQADVKAALDEVLHMTAAKWSPTGGIRPCANRALINQAGKAANKTTNSTPAGNPKYTVKQNLSASAQAQEKGSAAAKRYGKI